MKLTTFVQDANGKVSYHPLRLFIEPYTLTVDSPNQIISLAANAKSTQYPMSVSHFGHFNMESFVAYNTGPATIKIKDAARNLYLMNDEIHMDTICGSGKVPFILMEDMLLEANRYITIEVKDVSGLANDIFFAIDGSRIYHLSAPKEALDEFLGKRRLVETVPYFLTTDNGAFTIAGGVGNTAVKTATVDSFFDLELDKIMSVSNEDYTFRIIHNGRELSPVEVNRRLVTGVGEFPHVLRSKFLVNRNEQLEIHFTNLSANDNTIYFTMHGRAIFLNK